MAYCGGDASALLDDSAIRDKILNTYRSTGFGGLSLDEMLEKLRLPEGITVERVKHIIGALLAQGELEYVDFRCYRVYRRFADAFAECSDLDERDRSILRKRLDGITLETIGGEEKLTRERIRQLIDAAAKKVAQWYGRQTGLQYFDEDYYRYLYRTYSFEKKDAVTWLGIPDEVFRYLDMMDVRHGSRPLDEALSDRKIDAGLRLKIKNYLNKDRLFIDGVWVEKKRADLEELVIRKLCQEDTTFEEYIKLYNEFLSQHDIPYDKKIYYTP